MFNWVCPRCGKDVPPSKTECPFCATAPQAAPPQPVGAPPPYYPPPPPPQQYGAPPAPAWQPPQAAAPPQAWQPPQQWTPPAPPAPPPPPAQQAAWQPQAPPPQPPPPPHSSGYALPPEPAQPAPHPQAAWPQQKQGLPTWVLGGGFALALLAVLGLVYYWMQPSAAKIAGADKALGEKAAAATTQEKVANPLQKYIEVVGIRLVTQDKKSVAKFVVVNHSSGEIVGLEANVTLWASTKRSEEDSVGAFSFKTRSLGPNASADVTAPLTTRLKPYELPDWQNLTAEVQITSPKP